MPRLLLKSLLLGLGLTALALGSAAAQQVVNPCTKVGTNGSCAPVTDTAPLPVTNTPLGTQDVNVTKVGGNATAVGNGTTSTGTLRVTVSSDSTGSLSNPSIGANSAAAPTHSTQMGVSDGTNEQPVLAPIILGDGVNGNNTVSTGGFVWNGTSWDRMPGSAALGQKIQLMANPAITTVVGTNTATLPSSTANRVLNWVHVVYTAAATVGNRYIYLALINASVVTVGDWHAAVAITANQTRHVSFMPGTFRETSFDTSPLPEVQSTFPAGLVIPAGYTVKIYDATGVAATDAETVNFETTQQ